MSILILYATETGTSLGLAEKLHSRLPSDLSGIEACPEDWVERSLVVFIVSTTGEGDVPTSMKPFWNRLLMVPTSNEVFEDSPMVAVFGLGDSSYEKVRQNQRRTTHTRHAGGIARRVPENSRHMLSSIQNNLPSHPVHVMSGITHRVRDGL